MPAKSPLPGDRNKSHAGGKKTERGIERVWTDVTRSSLEWAKYLTPTCSALLPCRDGRGNTLFSTDAGKYHGRPDNRGVDSFMLLKKVWSVFALEERAQSFKSLPRQREGLSSSSSPCRRKVPHSGVQL